MNELAQYEKRLSRALCCPAALRKRLLANTRHMARDFMASDPDAAWDEVAEFLGDPHELARVMLEREDQSMLIQYRKRKQRLKWCVFGVAVAAFLLILVSFTYMYYERTNPVIMTETLIIYDTEDPA